MKRYKVIYADPPWEYDDKALAGQRGACCKYPVMSLEDLAKLPIDALADDDCVLFMWATYPKLEEACFPLIRAWGFTYKTKAFTWVKLYPKKWKPFMGMGRWTRSNDEIVLLATKGKPKRVSAGVSSIVETVEQNRDNALYYPIGEHSAKPPVIRDRIVDLCGDVPRVELFARVRTPGWDVWGNQVKSDLEIEGKTDAPMRAIQHALDLW